MEESSAQDPDLHLDLLKLDLDLKLDIIEKAENGDSFAQLDIGKACYSAINLENNCEKAYKWFHLSANQNNMEAQYKLGEMYAFGQGTKKNEHAAYDWYLKSALQGYSKALIRIHDLYHAEKNMHCRGQVDSDESEWTEPDFKEKNHVRELNEYRIEKYSTQLTSIIPYFEKLFKKCHEQIKDEKQEEKQDFYLKLGFLYQHGYGIRKIMTRSIEYYTLAAEKGNTDAQYNLGLIFHQIACMRWNHLEVLECNSQAFHWISMTAKNGNSNAQKILGLLYLKGLGTDIDNESAVFWYMTAAENRNVEAMVSLATLYRKGEVITMDEKKAIAWYEAAAKEGNIIAQSCLEKLQYKREFMQWKTTECIGDKNEKSFSKKGLCSRLYADALSIDPSAKTNKLEKLLKRTMVKDPDSMLEIGLMYFHGNFFTKDMDIGFRWIRKAAKAGSTKARSTIAEMYKNGDYIEQNYNTASAWYSINAKKEDSNAKYSLGKMYYKGLGVRKDPLEASKWYTFAADKNNSDAQCQLGVLRANGEGLREDLKEAIDWFMKSANQKNPEAIYRLALLYQSGSGFERNIKRAIVLFRKAAQLGCVDAQLKLAEYYSDLTQNAYDIKTGAKYFEAAARSGNMKAKFQLAILYLEGRGVDQDFITAYHLFKECQMLKYSPAENLFQVPIKYLESNDIDYDKLMIMFAVVSKIGIDSLEYNLGYHYNYDQIFAYSEELLTSLKDINSAKKWLRIAAKNKITLAQNELAALLEEEHISKEEFSKAIKHYEEASNNGSHDAAYRLGCMYLEGDSITQDLRKAFHLLYVASSSGCKKAAAILNLSDISHLNTTRDTILRMLEEGAASGNTITQYRLATLKLDVESSDYDIKGAVHYLAMASDGGYIDASYRLGLLFDEGAQVTQDHDKAGKYYQIAAEKRHESALFRLALLYHFGKKKLPISNKKKIKKSTLLKGLNQGYLKAHELYREAAREGSNLAQMAIDVVERSTWESKKSSLNYLLDGILFDYDNYLQMWERVAEMGDTNLQYKLGAIYETSSLDAAIKWYSKAAECSHAGALISLGRLHESGNNYINSVDFYEKAGEAGNNNAFYQLGLLYQSDQHGYSDTEKAIGYFKSAAEKGDRDAQYMLAKLYGSGGIIEQDTLESLKWYSKSTSQGDHNYPNIFDILCEGNPTDCFYQEKRFKLLSRIIKHNSKNSTPDKPFLGTVHYELGLCYFYGDSIPIEYKKAWEHFTKAKNDYNNQNSARILDIQFKNIEKSNRDLYLKTIEMFEKVKTELELDELFQLGLIYYKGVQYVHNNIEDVIIQPDQNEAIQCFKMISGSDSNDIREQFRISSRLLGMMYYFDTVSSRTRIKAQYYFRNSLTEGDAATEYIIKSLVDKSIEREKIYQEIMKWHMDNSKRGPKYIKICFNIGYMYYKALGVEKNYKEALKYFEFAAKKGFAAGRYKLGSLYHFGYGTDRNYKKAAELYKQAIEKNDMKARHNLGMMYENGEGYERNYLTAIGHYKESAEQGYACAQFKLGIFFQYGFGCDINKDESIKWFNKAADQNHIDANYNLALIYENDKNYDMAFKHFQDAAASGNVQAQFKLGCFYSLGYGVVVDFKEAFKWYIKAAKKGHIPANHKLGDVYLKGEGAENDYKLAFRHYEFAAVRDFSFSQFKLGYMYQHGQGVERDFGNAIKWYTRAAQQNHIVAHYNLGIMYENGQGTNINFKIAFKHYKIAAEYDYHEAQFKLGYFYQQGYGVELDDVTAMEWLTKSADKANIAANYNLGLRYDNGIGFKKDHVIAFNYFKAAADQGYSPAQFKLGYFFHKGYGGDIDYTKAVEWYKKAKDQGHLIAAHNIEYAYSNNDGADIEYDEAIKRYNESIDQDYTGAIIWYNKSMDQNDIEANYSLETKDDDEQIVERDYRILFEKYNNLIGHIYFDRNGSEIDYSDQIRVEIRSESNPHFNYSYNPRAIFDNSQKEKEYYSTVFRYYEEAAAYGLSYAQFKLGCFYYSGLGVEQSYEKASQNYEKAMGQGHILATYNLGFMHEYGKNFNKEKDNKKALEFYKTAAEQGFPQAQFRLGYICQKCNDYVESLKWYTNAASQGHIIAIYKIGDTYWCDQSIVDNKKIALKYYRQAAEQGYTYVEFKIATLYHLGYGVGMDYIKAREWYTKAIYKIIVETRNKMETSSKNKQNIDKSNGQKIDGSDEENTVESIEENTIKIIKKILRDYNETADDGDINLQIKSDHLYNNIFSDAKDFSMTMELLEKAADKNPEMYSLVGDMYLCNENSSQDFSKILEYYKKVPEGRNKSAALRGIGLLYEHGDGVEQNLEKAFEHYKMSADLNNKAACYNIALFYYKGIHVKQDFSKAACWFDRVTQKELNENSIYLFTHDIDDPIDDEISVKKRKYTLIYESVILGEAHYYIGKMYQLGQGVTQNVGVAAVYFEEAANYGRKNGMIHFKDELWQ